MPGAGGFFAHLWFLWVLMFFFVVMVALRGFARLFDPAGAVTRAVDRAVRWLVAQPVPVLLALPLCAAFVLEPGWLAWFGIPTPYGTILPNSIAAVGYGMAFARP